MSTQPRRRRRLDTSPRPGRAARRVQGGLLDPRQLWRSSPDAVRKLDPLTLYRNPVMFIVEIGAAYTTILAIADRTIFSWLDRRLALAHRAVRQPRGGGRRGPRQGPGRDAAAGPTDTMARRLRADGSEETVPAPQLQQGDRVVVEAGENIPGDGDVIEGIASVDESAITGESAPVIREAGGDRSSVTGGTRVLSDRIVVEITQKPGESFIDRMIALVEGANRQKTPNEIALNILLAA